jgi:hypothetical protein
MIFNLFRTDSRYVNTKIFVLDTTYRAYDRKVAALIPVAATSFKIGLNLSSWDKSSSMK